MARDNFDRSVIEKLKARVANRCSNPDCRVPTSGPSSGDKVNSIGVAAHICAASSGGPRYDTSMTAIERKSIENGIWLCSNCSIDIDRDVNRYTTSDLKIWKEKAEGAARVELGRKLPSASQSIDTLSAALTGYSKSYIASAISNIHHASGKALESLDPRFLVKTSHEDGATSIKVYAKEDVPLRMMISNESAKEYMEKHIRLIESGEDFEINSTAISIEGSKLFDEVFGKNKGTFSILTRKFSATQKLWLVQNNTNLIETFDDIQGDISVGTKAFTFKGAACNKLLSFSYRKLLDENDRQTDFTISLCLDQWEGVSLKFLPYFEKLLSLFDKMANGWKFFTSLELNGIKIFSSVGADLSGWDYIVDTSSFLRYVDRCRIISNEFRLGINYTSNVSYTADEHKYIADVVEIIEGKQVYDNSKITSNANCDLTVGDEGENVKALTEIAEPISIIMVQSSGDKINIFGVEVNLPSKVISLDSVLPKINGDIKNLKEDDIVKVEWLPQNGFKCTISYELA